MSFSYKVTKSSCKVLSNKKIRSLGTPFIYKIEVKEEVKGKRIYHGLYQVREYIRDKAKKGGLKIPKGKRKRTADTPAL